MKLEQNYRSVGNVLAAGTVTRVAQDGRLVLRTPEGVEVFASSGEAHIR